VLVVDDEIDTAETLAEVLTTLGHKVRTAHDGETAISEAVAFGPDVVLLDLALPGMGGLEVAQKLRALPSAERMRLIAVTGYGQDVDRKNTERAGFEAHLVKPLKISTLEELLAQR
jgi:CheY-like chemotaxis protein